MRLPSAGLKVFGGSVLQALTTAYAKLIPFSANAPANSGLSQYLDSTEGDLSVTGDVTNNRLLLFAPGVYAVDYSISGFGSAADSLIVQCQLAGVAILESTAQQAAPASSAKFALSNYFILNVPRPASGLTQIALELWAKMVTGSNLTIEYANFVVSRID